MSIKSTALGLVACGLAMCLTTKVEAAWVGYGSSWYNVTSQSLRFHDAEAEANTFGGHLVAVNDAAEQAFLTNRYRNARYFIGLTDELQEGQFRWTNGDAFTYSNWRPGEPNNFGDEDYVLMNFDGPGQWNDGNYGWILQGIIEVANAAPEAVIAAEATVNWGDSIWFDAAGSYDPNAMFGDSIVSYAWEVAGSTYTGSTLTIDTGSLGGAGNYLAVLTLTDTMGASASFEHQFAVTAAAVPEPSSLVLLGMGCVFLGPALRRARNRRGRLR